ncbi:hypothetical protein ACXAAV_11765 [Vibrio coralliilyticus]
MESSQYIKHPHFCQKYQSLTPHIQVEKTNKSDSKFEQKQSLFASCIEFLIALVVKDGEHTNSFFIDQEDQFQCE